ncbi:unnamed protein product [Absidia cylindrospora]
MDSKYFYQTPPHLWDLSSASVEFSQVYGKNYHQYLRNTLLEIKKHSRKPNKQEQAIHLLAAMDDKEESTSSTTINIDNKMNGNVVFGQQFQQQPRQSPQQSPPQSPPQSPSPLKRPTPNDDDSTNKNDDDYDFFMTEENILRLAKKQKTYTTVTPQQHASPDSKQLYQQNRAEQQRNACLKKETRTSKFLEDSLKQPLESLCHYTWTNGYYEEANEEDKKNIAIIRHLLLLSLNLYTFTWCEKGLVSNRLLSLCLPQKSSIRTLLDGIGVCLKYGTESLLIESSGEDNVEHSEEDTVKQIANTTNCLKMEMKRYQHASYDTFRRRQVFGLQIIDDRMTLTTTFIINKERYGFIELRSARIPISYDQRVHFRKVFELLLKLKAGLMEQQQVTEQLEAESTGGVDVDLTVEDALK